MAQLPTVIACNPASVTTDRLCLCFAPPSRLGLPRAFLTADVAIPKPGFSKPYRLKSEGPKDTPADVATRFTFEKENDPLLSGKLRLND